MLLIFTGPEIPKKALTFGVVENGKVVGNGFNATAVPGKRDNPLLPICTKATKLSARGIGERFLSTEYRESFNSVLTLPTN